jgi:hypothetical protein
MLGKIKKTRQLLIMWVLLLELMALLWERQLIKKFPQRDGTTQVLISLLLP